MRTSTQVRRRSKRLSAYADIQVELTHLIFHRLLVPVVLGCATLVGLTGVMAHASGDWNLWRCTLLMAFLSLLRVGAVFAFDHRPVTALTQASAAGWRMLYAAVTILYCLGFASETLYAFLHGDEACCLFSAMGTYALCSIFVSQPGTLPWVGQFCTVAMLAALDVGLIRHPGGVAIAGVVLNCTFAIIHCRGLRIRFETLAENLRSRRKLRILAEHDALTGLANRYHLRQSLMRVCEEGTPFAVLFIDLDGFKQVNDTYGHETGDQVLQQVAHRLQDAVRVSDLVARLGGDEFAILQIPVSSEQAVKSMAERITRGVARPMHVNGRDIVIGASIGIHVCDSAEDDPDRILDVADQALYRVKRAGGGKFQFAAQI